MYLGAQLKKNLPALIPAVKAVSMMYAEKMQLAQHFLQNQGFTFGHNNVNINKLFEFGRNVIGGRIEQVLRSTSINKDPIYNESIN